MTLVKKHVLIAEDDAVLAQLLRDVFDQHVARVTVAVNGSATKDLLEKKDVDLLILDLLMPQVDGFAVLQHMHEHYRDIPVFVLTNLSDKETRDRCRALGAKGYFVKSELDDDDIWPLVSPFLK